MVRGKKYFLLFISAFLIMIFAAASVNADATIHKGKRPAAAVRISKGKKSVMAQPKITALFNCSDGIGVKVKCSDDVWFYDIYRYDSGQTRYIGWIWGDEDTFIDEDVKNKWGQSYVYSVVAWDFDEEEESPVSNKPRIMRIAPVTFTYKQAKSYNQIQMKWKSTASGNKVTGYELEYARSMDDLRNKSGTFRKTVINSASTTSRTVSGLSAATNYYFRARAYCVYTVNGKTKKNYSAYTSFAKVTTLSKTPKYRALLIGNYNYPGSDSDLRCPLNDINAMAGTLGNYRYGCARRTNQSVSQILSSIKSIFAGAAPNDVSLFFYSGHGAVYGNMAYLCGTDDRVVSMSELAAALKNIPGKVIVVLNSCYSGNAIAKEFKNGNNGGYEPFTFDEAAANAFAMADQGLTTGTGGAVTKNGELRNSKFVVMAAGAKNESTYEYRYSDGVWGGLFTRSFVEGAGCSYPYGRYLGKIPCDTNYDKNISLNEMYIYTRRIVLNISQQIHSYSPQDNVQHVTCYPYGSTGIILKK